MAENWIQKAIKKPGSFRAWCQRRGYKGATKSCIEEAIRVAKKTGNKRLFRRAVLARTLKSFNKGGSKK